METSERRGGWSWRKTLVVALAIGGRRLGWWPLLSEHLGAVRGANSAWVSDRTHRHFAVEEAFLRADQESRLATTSPRARMERSVMGLATKMASSAPAS